MIDTELPSVLEWLVKAYGERRKHALPGSFMAPKFSKLVMEKMEDLAAAGDVKCIVLLAWIYTEGVGRRKDLSKSTRYYEMAARRGVDAKTIVAWRYLKGIGTARDARVAAYWYAISASQGNVYAKRMLGRMFIAGKGVSKDWEKGVSLLEEAYRKRDRESAVLLAWAHSVAGHGDWTLRAQWNQRAVKTGNATCMTILGVQYAKGLGVRKDLHKALHWYREAASRGSKLGRENYEWLSKRIGEEVRKPTKHEHGNIEQ